jgi:uncharacterized protein YwgA
MEAKHIALKLILDELNVSDNIESIDDRKRVQKAIYLGQLAGVQLGYRFGWYKKGPYSPHLTKDYYALAEAIEMGESDYSKVRLHSDVRAKLASIKPLFNVPSGIDLPQEDWLELVSSVHYLLKISKRDEEGAREVLQREKENLYPYAETAKQALMSAQLL